MKFETQYKYRAIVTKIVDGDTFDASVDLGYRMAAMIRFRVKGFDAPESYRPQDGEELVRGRAAKNAAALLLQNQEVLIQSYKEGVWQPLCASYVLWRSQFRRA